MPAAEALFATPAEGEFPVLDIEAWLTGQPFLLRDDTGLFLLCGDGISTQYARQRMLMEPDQPQAPVALVRLKPQAVAIHQRCSEESLRQARNFVEWLRDTYPCRITGPDGRDYTDSLADAYA
jgi:hypothetical protein